MFYVPSNIFCDTTRIVYMMVSDRFVMSRCWHVGLPALVGVFSKAHSSAEDCALQLLLNAKEMVLSKLYDLTPLGPRNVDYYLIISTANIKSKVSGKQNQDYKHNRALNHNNFVQQRISWNRGRRTSRHCVFPCG